jgi:hypothetical protein
VSNSAKAGDDATRKHLVRAHLRIAWVGLLAFATFGLTLEGLQGFKSASYLGVGNETRRLMWTLAHAHGVGLSLVQIGFAVTSAICVELPTRMLARASWLLNCAFVLIPGGFLLGGTTTYGGDPGIGVLLVPIGALLLLAALATVAGGLFRR